MIYDIFLTWVYEASDDGVLDTVVVELVVGPQGGQGPGPDGVGEEDLGGRVYPALRVGQFAPIWCDVQQQACQQNFTFYHLIP